MVRPLLDNVIVERVEGEAYKGSLHIPEAHRVVKFEAKVLAVGPGRWKEGTFVVPTGFLVGDTVIIGKFVGYEIELGERKLLCVRTDDILGVLDGNETEAKGGG